MEVWKIIFISKWVICRFHVNLPGCIRTVYMYIHGVRRLLSHGVELAELLVVCLTWSLQLWF